MSAIGGKADFGWRCRDVCFCIADMSGWELLPCKLIPEPYFASYKCLL